MKLLRTSLALITFFLVLLSVCTAQAGPLITAHGQTLCVLGAGDGTSWDWELRPAGGGTPFCSGTESFTGTQADLVTHIRSVIDLCDSETAAYPGETLGFPCPVGWTGFSIARSPNSTNWELAFEDSTNPGNLVVATTSSPESFNPMNQPAPGLNKPIPCNGNNICCGGEPPPCNSVPVPEPGTVASLLCGSFVLFGLGRLRRR